MKLFSFTIIFCADILSLEKKFYVHSGEKANISVDYQTFLKNWEWTDYLTFFINSKNKIIKGLQKNKNKNIYSVSYCDN